MKIRAAKSSEPIACQAIIFRNISELSKFKFTKEEKAYVELSIGDKKFTTVSIFRYPQAFYLVKVSDEGILKPQLQEKIRIQGNNLVTSLTQSKVESVVVSSESDANWAYYFAEGLALGSYQFLKYYSDKATRKNTLHTIAIKGLSADKAAELSAIIKGVYKARDLVNEPLSYLTATKLAEEAKAIGLETGFEVETFNKKKIESLKMGGLLAVNKGSIDPPTFSIITYKPKGAKNKKPLVLVGKGVVYDTGGMSLKPTANSMDSMKSDMGGAAAVVGAITAIAASKLPYNVVGLIPATDNRPGGNAYVPGDVITMYDGSTVEVLNTDAEGRMILADALAYAKKLNPELVIDLATLTGAAAVAVGKYGVVAMGTASEKVNGELNNAGNEVYERLAHLPFWDEYNDLLKSTIADVKNIGGREGGAITAGKFLQKFTDYPWVHLDIAGPAFLSAADNYRSQGGTGVGVRLLYEFVKSQANESK